MKTWILWVITCLLIVNMPRHAASATYAYLFTSDKVYKIDVAANKVVTSQKLPYNIPTGILKKTVFYDHRSNSLIVIQGKPNTKISAIDLKTFQFKNDLGISSPIQDDDLPTIIIPPTGTDFFVKWLDPQKSQEITTRFSNVDFNKVGDVPSYPFSYELLGYSADGTNFYSFKVMTPRELKIYDSVSLALKETRNLDGIFLDKNKPWDVKDYVADMILLSENTAIVPSDPNNSDIFYTYKINDKTRTSNITTKTKGDNVMLTPDKKFLLVSEATLNFITSNSYEAINTGKITIFNIASSEKVGTISVSVDKFSQITGISPDSTKAYVISKIPLTGGYKLSIIDLNKMSLITEIPNISFGREMIFFEE